MNKKIGFIVVSTLFLVIALFSAPLTFAQIPWDYCKVSAYGTNLVEFEGTSNPYRYEFTVAALPSGTEITNTVEVMDYDSGENYTINLSIGNIVRVTYDNVNPISNIIVPASESLHYTFDYEGPITSVTVNAIDVPEFPPILIVPLFMTATLLSIIYRRKHKK